MTPAHLANQTLERVELFNRHETVGGLDLTRCRLVNCSVGSTDSSARRLTIRDVRMTDCRADRCYLGPVILDGVTVDGFDDSDLMIVNACAYRHVVFRGRIRRVNVSWPCLGMAPKFNENINRLNREFHAGVDWAVDISEATFDDSVMRFDFDPRLLRRDPARQVIVRRRAVEGEVWRRVRPLVDPVVESRLSSMAAYDAPDAFEVVGTSAAERESVRILRAEGMVEPD